MATCGLSLLNGGTESVKNLEQRLFFQIGALYPYVINERFSFNEFIHVYLFNSISFLFPLTSLQVSANSLALSSLL